MLVFYFLLFHTVTKWHLLFKKKGMSRLLIPALRKQVELNVSEIKDSLVPKVVIMVFRLPRSVERDCVSKKKRVGVGAVRALPLISLDYGYSVASSFNILAAALTLLYDGLEPGIVS